MAMVVVEKMMMDAIVFMTTPWPIVSDDMYTMVQDSRNQAIDAQDHQWARASTSLGTQSVCPLPSVPYLKTVSQLQEAVCLGLCLILLYQIYDIDCAPNYAL